MANEDLKQLNLRCSTITTMNEMGFPLSEIGDELRRIQIQAFEVCPDCQGRFFFRNECGQTVECDCVKDAEERTGDV